MDDIWIGWLKEYTHLTQISGSCSWNQMLTQILSSLLVLEFSKGTGFNLPDPLPAHAHCLPYLLKGFHPPIPQTKPRFNDLLLPCTQTIQNSVQIPPHDLLDEYLL